MHERNCPQDSHARNRIRTFRKIGWPKHESHCNFLKETGDMVQTNPIKMQAGLRSMVRALCLLGLLITGLSARRAIAQVDQGTITGVVQDTTSAVIPGAEVTLTSTDTGLK